MADTKTDARPEAQKVRKGTEPVRKTPPQDRPINMNPSSKVPHSSTPFDQMAFNNAIASEDFGAARRLLHKDADVGIHDRTGDEVANPTKSLAGLTEGAAEQIERHKEVNRERAEQKDSQPISGAPRKDDAAKEDAGAALAAASAPEDSEDSKASSKDSKSK